MARFKLVKISKRKVEVQKVRFKPNFLVLLISFACAVFVWLYLTGTNNPPKTTTPEESKGNETVSAVIIRETASDTLFKGGTVGEA